MNAFARINRANRKTNRDPRRLSFEGLEGRQLMTATAVFDANQNLVITGDDAPDYVHVLAYDSAKQTVTVNMANDPSTYAPVTIATPGGLKKIVFNGKGGDDVFINDLSVPCEAHGGLGKDTLYGGAGDDQLYGDEGDDTLVGRGGNDKLYGGDGLDHLYGENDSVCPTVGTPGGDFLDGGNDQCVDVLMGGLGADTFVKNANDQYPDFNAAEGDTMYAPLQHVKPRLFYALSPWWKNPPPEWNPGQIAVDPIELVALGAAERVR
jgi:hypothetical protein